MTTQTYSLLKDPYSFTDLNVKNFESFTGGSFLYSNSNTVFVWCWVVKQRQIM